MKRHWKKMIAPVIITVILVGYYLAFFIWIIRLPQMSLAIRILAGAVPLVLAGVGAWALRERIQEIRSGEEDDLSQY